MCAITNLGVSCDLGTCPGAVCFTWGATSGRTVTWSSSTLSCLRLSSAARKRGQGAHHRALPCHPGAERVYKRRNTDGSSVSVVKSSTTELRHVCRYYPGGVTESRIWRLIRGVAHHTLRSLDPSSAWRDGTTEYARHLSRVWSYSQRWILRRDSSRQNIPIMGHYK